MAVTRPSHNVGKVRWGSRAFITRMKTLDIDIPTPLKTIRLMNRVKLLLPIATVKNQLMGTEASLYSLILSFSAALECRCPTSLKTIRLMNRVKLLLPIATVKNQLMGTDASIASAPKLT